MKYKYDQESNILSIQIKDAPFDYAEEVGDFVVHFDKRHKPVYLEILNAQAFVKKSLTLLPSLVQKELTGAHV